jgi:biopolymer transport protein ExbD
MDVAPMVDMTLLLLIFFLLTSTFVFQPGIKVDQPVGTGAGSMSTRYIIAVLPQDPPLIFFNDQMVTREKLEERLSELAQSEFHASIILKADRLVPHGVTMGIMHSIMSRGFSVIIATDATP